MMVNMSGVQKIEKAPHHKISRKIYSSCSTRTHYVLNSIRWEIIHDMGEMAFYAIIKKLSCKM